MYLSNNNKNNFVYHNLKDKAKLDQKTEANNAEKKNKIESKSHSDLQVEAIVLQPAR